MNLVLAPAQKWLSIICRASSIYILLRSFPQCYGKATFLSVRMSSCRNISARISGKQLLCFIIYFGCHVPSNMSLQCLPPPLASFDRILNIKSPHSAPVITCCRYHLSRHPSMCQTVYGTSFKSWEVFFLVPCQVKPDKRFMNMKSLNRL